MKYSHLLESATYDEIRSQPYFDRFPDIRLYHGTKSPVKEPSLVPFRYRKAPKDTPQVIHDTINEKSVDKFGIPVRNLFFTYQKPHNIINYYGEQCIAIPKGKFRLFCNPLVNDMTTHYDLDMYSSNFYTAIFEEVISRLVEFNRSLNYDESMVDADMVFWLDKLESNYRKAIAGYNGGFVDQMESYILEVLQDHIKDETLSKTFTNQVLKVTKEVFSMHIHKMSDDYMKTLIELDTASDIYDRTAEMMLYAPEGMYMIPEHTKLFNTFYKG